MKSILERFEEKIYPEPNTGCWLWGAYCISEGYGVMHVDGKNKFANASFKNSK